MKFISVTEVIYDITTKTSKQEAILLNSNFVKRVICAKDFDRNQYGCNTILELVAGQVILVKEAKDRVEWLLAKTSDDND